MLDYRQCNLRPMTPQDLDMVLMWRNHPKIRQHMLTQHHISHEEHALWFEKSAANLQRKIMLIECNGVAFGLVHFNGIEKNACTEWGFYLSPDAPKGSGTSLGTSALTFAFNALELHKVCGQVLDSNHASIRFHERFGFKLEGRLREQVPISSEFQDLLCFGLLKTEWSQHAVDKG